nr:PREDICTED: neuronal PAS domain-containing protein 4-like [Struthio camelus australis]
MRAAKTPGQELDFGGYSRWFMCQQHLVVGHGQRHCSRLGGIFLAACLLKIAPSCLELRHKRWPSSGGQAWPLRPRPLQAETSCLPRRARQAPSASKPFRSTKGASKARRDQINAELQALRSLLPISSQEKERLSYLNTMALVCLWLRRAHLFPPDSAPPAAPAFGMELLSLLPGFFLVLLANGKLAYISENVAQVLGLSTVELLAQGDTVFDILDGPVQEAVQEKLLLAQEQPGTEVTFVSKMRTSKAFRLQHGGNRAVAVRGRFVALHRPASPCASAFMAFCTPVAQLPADGDAVSQDDLFRSVHALDMTFTDVTESVIYHLGYHREELIGRSWYSLLHPDDTSLAAAQHRAVGKRKAWEHARFRGAVWPHRRAGSAGGLE